MSSTSPQKRRSNAFRTSMIEQPMRQTRSMARLSDVLDTDERSLISRRESHRQPPHSSHPPSSSPRKARASQAAQIEKFDPDSPDISLAACMESPKKGRFDDFEFEIENSTHELPIRRRRIAADTRTSTSPSADVGLPRSKPSSTLSKSTTTNPLHASRKENSTSTVREPAQPGASPMKPAATVVRPSRLHGTAAIDSKSSGDTKQGITTSAVPMEQSSSVDTKPFASGRESSQRLVFDTARASAEAPASRNPFSASADVNSLAQLGEPRHSPVKRIQTKSEFILQSPDRPDRKPINLLELKPSPGKAQRGIFRHNAAIDDQEEDDWDTSDLNIIDEVKLVKGPSALKHAESRTGHVPSSSRTADASAMHKQTSTTSSLDVKRGLSSETSDALASLEASLAKLKAKTPTQSAAGHVKKEDESVQVASKRELGGPRASGISASRTMSFRTKTAATAADTSIQARSVADQSGDSSVFKRPSGRISALAKSRESSSEHRSDTSLTSSKSMMSFGAPKLPGFSELGGKPSRSVLPTARAASRDVGSDDSRNEEQAAAEEEQARIAEANRQAQLKAAKRRSMSSILSSGMPPPLHRKEASASSQADARAESSTKPTSPTPEPSVDSAEARKAAKTARRRSLFTYVPTKREETDGDRSIGNLSTGLIITANRSGNASEADTSTQAARKARFLRGLTVLVDVRDQDGEDASACWVEMLKNAGAKVMVRFGERKLTHIVYKSGRPGTLHSYRALEDPKPHVVGISWVVACLEQGKKADELPYLVEVAKQAIFANPRRSSMAPRQVPSSATSIRELPKELQKDVEQARRKLLVHAPAVSSPLRRRVSSRSMLASRLAATSLNETADAHVPTSSSSECKSAEWEQEHDDDAALAAYRARVMSVLSQPDAIAT